MRIGRFDNIEDLDLMLETEYTKISMLTDENNYQAWAIPIATEQRYYITWGASGDLKFEEMKIV